jgi:hypothetical protein
MDDQNSTNTPVNDQPADVPQADANQMDQSQEPAQAAPVQDDTQPAQDFPVDQPQQTDQTQSQPAPDYNQPQENAQPAPVPEGDDAQVGDYIENVGGSVIDLLNDVNESDELVQIVANEMRLDNAKVKILLASLINKINQGQVTMEELALLMAAPVVDEPAE